jgi:hypothetical protein
LQVRDTASFQACERAVAYCGHKRGGCAAKTPPQFKLNGAVGNSLFFVNQSPYLSRMTSMIATVLRYYCPVDVCPVFFNNMITLPYEANESELMYVKRRYTFISREFNKEDEQSFAVSHPERYASGAMTMLEAPEERMTRQFKYDSLADPQVRDLAPQYPFSLSHTRKFSIHTIALSSPPGWASGQRRRR